MVITPSCKENCRFVVVLNASNSSFNGILFAGAPVKRRSLIPGTAYSTSTSYQRQIFLMIDTEGNVFGYVQGAVSREVMDDIVEQTRTGQRR